MLPKGTLLAQAAKAEAQTAMLPGAGNHPINHFVFVMMENRSLLDVQFKERLVIACR